MRHARPLLLLAIAAALGAAWSLGLLDLLTFANLKAQADALEAWRATNPVRAMALFFVLYVAITGLSLPGAAILTLAAGAIFGLVAGTLIVSFASTLGATLAFLAARFLLRDRVRSRFGPRLEAVDAGLAQDGAFYLFTLRLVPLFPFFLVNLLMGLTAIRPRTFALVSQLGMLPGTIVYVNAGTQLATIDSPAGILSPALIASFVALGLFPWAARWGVAKLRAARG